MCFGSRNVNVEVPNPASFGRPVSIQPPPPVQIPKAREVFKPLQSPDTAAGVQLAGTAKRRKEGADPTKDRLRRSLSSGSVNMPTSSPSGGINL